MINKFNQNINALLLAFFFLFICVSNSLNADITPIMLIENFKYTIINEEKPGFIIYLNNETQRLMYEVSSELIGEKMAIVLDRNILHIAAPD